MLMMTVVKYFELCTFDPSSFIFKWLTFKIVSFRLIGKKLSLH